LPAANPEVSALLAWSEEFEAGMVNDPALLDGTLDRGERVAVRGAPITTVRLEVKREGPAVTGAGSTGSMLATDRRVLLAAGGDIMSWWWARDVGEVTPLRNYLGVMWSPSEARFEAGAGLEGLVLPEFARGDDPLPPADAGLRSLWVKVQVAWRASQPGGVADWRAEFSQRHRG
jgi:hypothetical protein